jgi:uncharacterized protein YndB with AHSA1/START domain
MSDPLYFVERDFNSPIDVLWRAWTEEAELESWYCPVFLEVVPNSAVSEARVGGQWAIAVDVSANGFNAYFWGKYLEVQQHKKLVHEMNYSQDELEFALRESRPDAHLIHVDFEEITDGCKVRFSQFGQMDAQEAEAAREGMESYFDNLEKHLEKV